MLSDFTKKIKNLLSLHGDLAKLDDRIDGIYKHNAALTGEVIESFNVMMANYTTASTAAARELANSNKNAIVKSEIRTMGRIARILLSNVDHGTAKEPRLRPKDFKSVIEMFQNHNPALFAVWHRLFENGAKAYASTKIGNCSHNELEAAILFKDVIDTYSNGNVLDVGCGPYADPSYLSSIPRSRLWGLEPLPLLEASTFHVERGFGECIPWDQGSFDTVVSAAALDHAFSLKMSLDEIARVMTDSGRFLLWIASVPGADEFIEDNDNYIAFDEFHIFHFDEKWFNKILLDKFNLIDKFIVNEGNYDHIYYVLTKKRN
jgi:SAM-dependent methyltransferase